MCVTRRGRPPSSVEVDKLVNTSAIYAALCVIWHFVRRQPSSNASFIHEVTFT